MSRRLSFSACEPAFHAQKMCPILPRVQQEAIKCHPLFKFTWDLFSNWIFSSRLKCVSNAPSPVWFWSNFQEACIVSTVGAILTQGLCGMYLSSSVLMLVLQTYTAEKPEILHLEKYCCDFAEVMLQSCSDAQGFVSFYANLTGLFFFFVLSTSFTLVKALFCRSLYTVVEILNLFCRCFVLQKLCSVSRDDSLRN